MTPQPFVDPGSVGPVPLQGMMIVERFICQTGGPVGSWATASGARAADSATERSMFGEGDGVANLVNLIP